MLRNFGFNHNVYVTLIESIIMFNISITWLWQFKNKLHIIFRTKLLIDNKLNWINCVISLFKARSIIADHDLPLYSDFKLMPSKRHYRTPPGSKEVYKGWFAPRAIDTLNSEMLWCVFIVVLKCCICICMNVGSFEATWLVDFLTWWNKDNFPLIWLIKLFYSI